MAAIEVGIQMNQKIQILKWMGKRTHPHIISLITLVLTGSVSSIIKVIMAYLSKDLIDSFIGGITKATVQGGILFAASVLILLFGKWLITVLTVHTTENMTGSLKEEVYEKLAKTDWMEYARYHTGDMATRVNGDTQVIVNGIINGLTRGATSVMGLAAAFFVLMSFHRGVAFFSVLVGPVALILGAFAGSRYVSVHEEAQKADSSYRSYLQECLEHMLIIKTFGREGESRVKLRELQAEKKRLALKRNYTSAVTNTLIMIGLWIGFLAVFGWGAAYVLDSTLTVGTITAYIQLILQVILPFIELASLFPMIYSAAGSAKRIIEVEGLREDLEPDKAVEQPVADAPVREKVNGFESIDLKELTFAYTPEKLVLKDITFSLEAGDILALTGASGEGKTTLIYLLMQLLRPTGGHIYIKDKGINYDLESCYIRQLISYVPQGNTLFSGTIEENLRVGDSQADREEQKEMLKAACAWEFVSELPQGLDTSLGERGVGLSEGQAQRISIARALIRKKPLLILDEATSALDMDTEREVIHNISKLREVSCIIITHRLSILRYCRRVLELNGGRLRERSAEEILSEFNEMANEVAATGVI
jgi:ABC-type multidrug transport system fused ATPase/permease subunit